MSYSYYTLLNADGAREHRLERDGKPIGTMTEVAGWMEEHKEEIPAETHRKLGSMHANVASMPCPEIDTTGMTPSDAATASFKAIVEELNSRVKKVA